MTTDPFNTTLINRQDVTDDLCIIRLRPDSGQVPDFEPGQSISIGLPRPPTADRSAVRPASDRPRLIRRAYSIASSPVIRDYVELYVALVGDGKLTPRVWDLHPNDRLWMDHQIKGEFTLQGITPGKDLVMVGTGTGLAPYISMLRTYRGQSRWNRFVIIHGVRLAQDLGYRQELERISAEDPTVFYIPMVTREPESSPWQGMRGRVQVALEDGTYQRLMGGKLDSATCQVFLCGNPDMISCVQSMLELRGFVMQTRQQPGNIHFERYW